MRTPLLAAAALLVAACSSAPERPQPILDIVLGNSVGVSYEYANVPLKTVAEKAQLHCSGESKRALMNGGVMTMPNGHYQVTFSCK